MLRFIPFLSLWFVLIPRIEWLCVCVFGIKICKTRGSDDARKKRDSQMTTDYQDATFSERLPRLDRRCTALLGNRSLFGDIPATIYSATRNQFKWKGEIAEFALALRASQIFKCTKSAHSLEHTTPQKGRARLPRERKITNWWLTA